MSTELAAKKYLVGNVATNLLAIVANVIVTMWYTPFLIRHLGVAVYGLVPLCNMVVSYLGMVMLVLTATTSRFVTVHLSRGENQRANVYYSTAFYQLLLVSVVLLVVGLAAAPILPALVHIPAGFERSFQVLFVLTLITALVTALTSPFSVCTFVKHRFSLSNYAKILSLVVRVSMMVACFKLLSARLEYVGLSFVAPTFIIMGIMMWLTRRLCPELRLSRRTVDWNASRDMMGMGAWSLVAEIGSMFYQSIDLILINLFLGAELGGYYAPLLQISLLIGLLTEALSSVFSPVAYEYVGRGEVRELVRQTQRVTKFMGIALALPVGLCCGFGEPLLRWWLGESFARYSPLLWLLVGPNLLNYMVRPMFAINRAQNMVKVPAIVTLGGGLINLGLAIVLLKHSSLGLYAVATASTICLLMRNAIFTPLYCGITTGASKGAFFHGMAPGGILAAGTAFFCFGLTWVWDVGSFWRLAATSTGVALVFAGITYWVAMHADDRRFMWGLVGLNASPLRRFMSR